MNKVELLDDCKNSLGEGITYSSINNNLYWLDIGNISKLYKLDLSSNKKQTHNYIDQLNFFASHTLHLEFYLMIYFIVLNLFYLFAFY